jgi:hypothetical protein
MIQEIEKVRKIIQWWCLQFMLNTCMTSLEPFEQRIFVILVTTVSILLFHSIYLIFTTYFYALTVEQIVNLFIFIELYFRE